jgi:quercetin dioxygenase-like cupin family protein
MDHAMRFSVSHAATSPFRDDGLRPFFQYRDLGIREATGNRFVAHVIRAKPGMSARPERHHHRVEFQMVYVLKGWIRFHYEGVGEVTLEAGSCVHQPPGIRHTELGHSDDLELIEIVLPADFETVTDP